MIQRVQLTHKEYNYNIQNQHTHTGEYFEIIHFQNKYLLFFCEENTITLVISNTLDFNTYTFKNTIIENAPGGCFCIVKDKNTKYLYMLCGNHSSNKESDEINIPDLVWPKEKRTIIDWKKNRNDRKNGMYLLQSKDGKHWKEIIDKPVLHSYIQSNTCRLGEVCFDTHPQLIQYDNTYYFYGRLNSSLDERRIYVRKSNDLKIWSTPIKINIKNENNNTLKKNYYNFAVFQKDSILYACTPYFEACGTKKRQYINGQTLLLRSYNGIDWTIEKSFLHHIGRNKYKKYTHRVNSVYINNSIIKIFLTENVLTTNQKIKSYILPI